MSDYPVKAEYRRLGKTVVSVSVPVFGGMGIGNPNWNPISVPQAKAIPLLEAAWNMGVTTLDLANMYTNGECETIVGNFIKEKDIPRNKLVIIDKIRFLVDHEESSTITSFSRLDLKDTRDYVNHGGLSRLAIFNQVQDCLNRLQTDYIDILLIHMTDLETPFEETMSALNDLVRSGKVHYLGASNVKTWEFIEMNNVPQAHAWTQFSCVQMEHSLLYRTEERDLFAYCNHQGMGILGYSPLASGNLARQPGATTPRTERAKGAPFKNKLTDSDLEIIKRVTELSQKHGWTMAQVALAWSVTKVSSHIVGANTRLRETISNGKRPTQEEVTYLEEPYAHKPPRL